MRFIRLGFMLGWIGQAAAGRAQSVETPPGTPSSAPQPAAQAPVVPAPEPPLGKLSPLGKAPDWALLQALARQMTRAEFQKAWDEVYSEVNGPPPPWQVTDDALVVPTTSAAQTVSIAFRKAADEDKPTPPPWRTAATLPPLAGRPVLSDLRIALDPGHIGGAWARMEERYLSFKEGEAVCEGDLTLLTARVLAERLQALGALVTLVRDQAEPVTQARPQELESTARALLAESGFPQAQARYEGLEGDAKLLTVQWQSEKLFYRVSEIHARGEKVNTELKPDVVLCLHFNAESWGAAAAPQFSPQNHLHVLVNGCCSRAELLQQDVRHEMLLRLLGRIHEEEIPLATAVVAGVARSTGLPAYVYTTPNARRAGEGGYVYARNLLANRIYRCPVVYLEPFVMNHEETYRRLLAGHFMGRTLIGGRLVTSAVEDYVSGIVDGLTSYYRRNRRP